MSHEAVTSFPGLADMRHPGWLTGPRSPDGTPIADEHDLAQIWKRCSAGEMIFACSAGGSDELTNGDATFHVISR